MNWQFSCLASTLDKDFNCEDGCELSRLCGRPQGCGRCELNLVELKWLPSERVETRRKRVPSQGKCFECHARMRVISKFITRTARVRRLEPSGTSQGLSTVNLQDPHGGAHAVIIGHQGCRCRRRSVCVCGSARCAGLHSAQLCQGCRARVNYWRSKGEARAALLPFPTSSTHPCSRSDDLMETIADSCICNEIDCEGGFCVDLVIFFHLRADC
jgi:hypothetical protein